MSSLCTHAFHHTDSKDPDIHVLDGECRQQKNTQNAPSAKTESDYLNGWIKKTVTYAKISSKMLNPRDIGRNAEEEEQEQEEQEEQKEQEEEETNQMYCTVKFVTV